MYMLKKYLCIFVLCFSVFLHGSSKPTSDDLDAILEQVVKESFSQDPQYEAMCTMYNNVPTVENKKRDKERLRRFEVEIFGDNKAELKMWYKEVGAHNNSLKWQAVNIANNLLNRSDMKFIDPVVTRAIMFHVKRSLQNDK